VNSAATSAPIVRADRLTKYYPVASALPWKQPSTFIRAVDGISFEIAPHRTLSIVGETGCGKTTTAKLVLRLEQPTSGRLTFLDHDLQELDRESMRHYRRSVQAVFQNPFSSLNPRMRILEIVGEPRTINDGRSGSALLEEVEQLLIAVGLSPSSARAFPHELSGGMRQRVALARALSLRPSLIVLDEPVSALDVSIRAQIINLLKEIQEGFGIAYLLIAHDLATTRYLSHCTAVMYLGEIVETGETDEIFATPLHPYTKALISAAAPARRWEGHRETTLSGEVPSATAPPSACRFRTRCPLAFDRCSVETPLLREIAPGHHAACHLY
jgi:oligopeptide/dipeptide ABC transporter ATP-binding protein